MDITYILRVVLRIVCFLLHDIYPSSKQTLALLSNHQNTSMYCLVMCFIPVTHIAVICKNEWKTCLTHWGRVTHICVSKLTNIGSNNGLSPGRRQAIIWINAGILLIGHLGTNFSEILIEIHTFAFKMQMKISSGKWRPFCLGLNVLKHRIPLNAGSVIVCM